MTGLGSNWVRTAAAAALLSVGAIIWWVMRPAPPPIEIAPSRPSSAIPSVQAQQTSLVAGIPEQTPLVGYVQDLVRAADAGDVGSACRLGFELARCKLWHEAKDSIAASRRKVLDLPFNDDDKRKLLADIDAQMAPYASSEWICSKVSSALSDRAFEYMAMAANAGDVRSMVRVAITPPLQQLPRPSEADSWKVYRSQSHKWLSDALEAGDVRAYWVAFLVSAGKVSPTIVPNFPRDAERAIVYGTAVQPALSSQGSARVAQVLNALARAIGPEKAAKARDEGLAIQHSKLSGALSSGTLGSAVFPFLKALGTDGTAIAKGNGFVASMANALGMVPGKRDYETESGCR